MNEAKNIIIGGRQKGNRKIFFDSMVETLNSNKSIGVIGCTDPDELIESLKLQNIDAEYKPMTIKSHLMPDKITGYSFKLKS